jgi:hypothetical protein
VPWAQPAQGEKTAKKEKNGQRQEELKEVVARRIKRATGLRVRIHDLVYEVFTSSFVGKGIEVGPKGRPIVRIPDLRAKLVLFSSRPGTTLAKVRARGPSARVPSGWIERPYRYTLYRSVSVRAVEISDAKVTVLLDRRGRVELSGIQLKLLGLKVPKTKAGRAPAMSGAITLKIKRVSFAGLELSDLTLEGRLDGKALRVRRLVAGAPGGRVSLKGSIGLGPARGGLGPFDLSGAASGPALKGTVKLAGPSLARLVLEGKLDLQRGKKVPRRGGTRGAPASLRLKLRLGKRTLGGTLRRWRVR